MILSATNRWRLGWAFAAALLLAQPALGQAGGTAPYQERGTELFVFRPIAATTTPTDFSGFGGVSPQLNEALRAYQTSPSLGRAIGVLQFFTSDFYTMTADERQALFTANKDLFLSVDVAKYELVMQARKALAARGARIAKRVGSSGLRELEIINWRYNHGPEPVLDPAKQFVSDDDVTLMTAAAASPADEAVNSAAAKDAYRSMARSFGVDLDPSAVQTEFLSPTQAWEPFRQKYGSQIPAPPNYLFAFVAANPEKYNDPFGVYMLDKWGYDKGVVTLDVTDPIHTTKRFSEVYDPPDEAPASGMFAYIADNYRQIHVVHGDRFESQCKYLVRMIDAWTTVMGPGSVTPEWRQVRDMADAIYKKGIDITGAKEFQANIRTHIRNVIVAGHAYQLTRVEAEIERLLPKLKGRRSDELTPQLVEQLMTQSEGLTRELDGLLIAYVNTPPDYRQALLEHFAARITNDEGSTNPSEVMAAEFLKRAMEVVQGEAAFQRGGIEALASLKGVVNHGMSEALSDVMLDQFLLKAAKGEVRERVWRLTDGPRIVSEERVLNPQEVLRQVALIKATAETCEWPEARQAARLQEYFTAGPDNVTTGLRLLLRLARVFDASNAKPIALPPVEAEGRPAVPTEILPSGVNTGLALFSAALWGERAVLKGGEWWGHAKNGAELFKNLDTLLNDSNGMDDLAIGQTQAALFANALNLEGLVATRFAPDVGWLHVTGAGALTSNTAGLLAADAGAVIAGDSKALDSLFAAAARDMLILWQPELAPAIVLSDLMSWGYREWSVSGERNDIIDLMVENGVWAPASAKDPRTSPDGLPVLKGIRTSHGTIDVTALAKRDTQDVTLEKSKTTIASPRQTLMALGEDAGYFEAEPLISTDVTAIEDASGNWVVRSTGFGELPRKQADWTKAVLAAKGILVSHAEDDRSKPVRPGDIAVHQDGADATRVNELRVMGYLVGDLWVKKQILVEDVMLPALEKEAARRYNESTSVESADTTGTFTDQLPRIYARVKAIDERLWPHVALSAGPARDGIYDPDRDTPILDAFRDGVRDRAAELDRIQAFLKSDSDAPLEVRDAAGLVDSVTKPKALARANQLLQTIWEACYQTEDEYGRVLDILDRGAALAATAKVSGDPAYVKFLANDDPTTAKDWLDHYLSARKQVLADIVDRTKAASPDSWLGALWQEASDLYQKYVRDSRDTSGSPAHPLWPDLIRLRFQIEKLGQMDAFAEEMTPAEFTESVRPMTVEREKPVSLDKGISSPASRRLVIVQAKTDMEAEYRRLLGQLTSLFTFAPLKADDVSPFIGQPFHLTATARVDPSVVPPGRMAATGFPDFVAGFHWTVWDKTTLTTVAEVDSETPVGTVTLSRAGTYLLQVAALDRGRNVVAKSEEGLPVTGRPLTLQGTVGARVGDYEGETIGLLPTITGLRGALAVNQLGPFELEVDEFDAAAWAKARMSARVAALGRSADSNSSGFDPKPATGIVRLKDELLLPFPFNVTITVGITDRAGLEVPAATATVFVAGNLAGNGRSVSARLWAGTPVSASVGYAALGIDQPVKPVTFEASDKHALALKITLPMFDVQHVTVTGRLVPDASLTPRPEISGGQIATAIGNSGVASGAFSFTNARPIDLRTPAILQATIVATDTNQKIYRPKAEPVTASLGGRRVDLGTIEIVPRGITVKPIQATLFDIVGTPLPEGTGELLIDSHPAARNGAVFVGEYTFTRSDESVTIQGGYRLPGGQLSVVQRQLSAAAFMGARAAAPPAYAMKLPFYLPGDLHLTGTIRVERARGDSTPPGDVTLEDAVHGLQRTQAATAFDVTLAVPVQLTENIALAASAKGSPPTSYAGAVSAKAPTSGGALALGEIVLSAVGTNVPAFLTGTGPQKPSAPAGAGGSGPSSGDTPGSGGIPTGTAGGDPIAKARATVEKTAREEQAGHASVAGVASAAQPKSNDPFYVFDIDISGGSIWIGQESSLKTTPACHFWGGGNCPNGPPRYAAKSAGFATLEEATKAWCGELSGKKVAFWPIAGDSKAEVYGKSEWLGLAPSCK